MNFAAVAEHRFGRATPSLRDAPQRQSMERIGRESIYRDRNAVQPKPATSDVYRDVLDDVLAAYWRDYEDHKDNFMPAFFTNDILRLWRTFCVNYEARTERMPEREKAKGKLKNYKLKHSRLLTCYSAILCLIGVYAQYNSVHPNDAKKMIELTPTGRLEWLREQPYLSDTHRVLDVLLAQYEKFLETTNASEEELIECFMNKIKATEYLEAAGRFGDLVFDALSGIGQRSRFHKLVVV